MMPALRTGVISPFLSPVFIGAVAVGMGVVACSSGSGGLPSGSGGHAASPGSGGVGAQPTGSSGGADAASGGAGAPATGGETVSGTGGGQASMTAGSGGSVGGSGGRGSGGSTGTAGSGANPGAGGAAASPAYVDLFNGVDLTGFNVYKATTAANNAPGMLLTGAAAQAIFKPETGVIHVYGDLPDQSLQNHYLLQTVAAYGRFNVSWEYKWGTKKFALDATGKGLDLVAYPRDAGVLWYIHGDKTQVWPSAIEFQNKWGSTGDIFALYAQCRSLGVPNNLVQFAEATAGGVPTTVVGGLTQHKGIYGWETPGVGAGASTGEGSDWNTCLLQVDAGTATYTLNGHVVNRTVGVMDSSGRPVTSGYIAWQAEQAEVFYRNLRIQVLP